MQDKENSNQDEHQNDKNAKRKTIVDKIGNYFSSPEALILFNCRDNEMVDDCLSRRIDMFDDVINHKKKH